MSESDDIIDSRSFTFAGAVFDIQITDLYQDIENQRKYYVCWQVVCEGQT